MQNLQQMSPKQIKSLNEANSRINIWEGAVRSGKSYASLWKWLEYIQNGPAGDLMMIGRTDRTIKRNLISELIKFLGLDVKYYSGKGELHLWGRTIYLIGANDERAEGKIRGSTIAGAYVDEVSLIPESFFKMLLSRLSVEGSKLFGTTNTDSPFHWLKRDFLEKKEELDLSSWHFSLEDNPSLSQSFIKNIKREYRGLWYQRFIEGKWLLAEGTVYDFFDPAIHTIDHPNGMANYYIIGIDYGTQNPTGFALIGFNPNIYPNIWLEKEYYYDSKENFRQKTDTEFADDLKKFINGYNIEAIYLDPSAASFKMELRKQKISPLLDAKNDVLDGIRFQSMLLSNGTYKICKRCKNTIKEYGTYIWDPKSSQIGIDKPLKENDHLMDAQRYALYSHFFNYSDSDSLSPERIREMKMKHLGYRPNTVEEFMKPGWS